MNTDFAKKRPLGKYLRDFAIVTVVSALIAVTIDYICYLAIGETSAGTWYDKYWMGFFFCCAFILSSFIVLRNRLSDRPEYLYLIIVLLISIFITWSLSLFMVGWDTGIHFRNVLGWADLDDQFELSRSELAFTTTSLRNDDGSFFPFTLDGIHQMESWLNANNMDVQEIRTAFSFRSVITNINYLPCAAVMFVCETFKLPFSLSYFLSLIPSPLIYSVVTFLGMKKLRSGKMLYAVISLFPTSVFLAANYGYQYWNTSFFLYGFACLASFIQNKQLVPIRQIALMLISLVLASLPRLSYAPLILLALLIPKKCFKNNIRSRIYRISIIAAALLVVSMYAIPILVNGFGAGDSRGGDSVNPQAQLSGLLSEPVNYLMRLIAFMAPPFAVTDETTYANDVISGFLTPSGLIRTIGFYGYLGFLPYPLFLLLLTLLTATTITDRNEFAQYGWIPGAACIVISLASLICIITYLYMDFNNVGENAFRGVQSRYLLPFIYPCLAFLGSHKWGLNGSLISSKFYNGLTLGIMTFILLAGWWSIYLVKIY